MRAWRWSVITATLLAIPRCNTGPPCANHAAPNATFDVAKGCSGYYCAMLCDAGFVDCNGVQADGCESVEAVPNGRLVAQEFQSTCTAACDNGFFDCDGNLQNGCESTTACTDASTEPKTAHVIVTLLDAPHGLVACAGHEYYFDGLDMYSIDSLTLQQAAVVTSPQEPAGGLACDGKNLYWATLSDSDASPNGALLRFAIGFNESVVASAIDPRSGIEWRNGELALMTSSGLSLAKTGSLAPWMPASETGAYKPFVLGAGADWSISGRSIFRRDVDAAAAAPWLADAGAFGALVITGDAGNPVVVVRGDAGDTLASIRDDAGAPALDALDAAVHSIVTSASGTKAIVASDDSIYAVTTSGATPIFTSSDQIADVAVDGTWVVWTTRNPPALWRGALP
jgi:hypothetical protein